MRRLRQIDDMDSIEVANAWGIQPLAVMLTFLPWRGFRRRHSSKHGFRLQH
jgi:hypothetical protein